MKTILSFVFILFITLSTNAQPAPDFSVTDVSGNSHSLYADYLNQGKTVLIKIYFTTCPPCRAIAPATQALYEEWGAGQNDVQFFDITTRDWETDSMHIAYKTAFGVTFPSIGGPGGANAARNPYVTGVYGQFTGTPTFIVISPDGTVNFNIEGANASATIALLDAAIAATGATKPNTAGEAPVSRGISVATEFNTSKVMQLEFFGRDSPVDSTNIIFKPISGMGNSGGTFTPATDSCLGCVRYTPNNGFVGLDQIGYCVIDQESDTSNVSTITVQVLEEMDPTMTVSGVIRSQQGNMLDAKVIIKDGPNVIAELGNPYSYTFNTTELAQVREYTIEAIKEDGLLIGVSALDINVIQKHLLGLVPFENTYQEIAADVNGSGTVSALDMADIRKILLGITNDFDGVPSWRIFVEEEIRQDNPIRTLKIKDILNSTYSGDFIGVKSGDPSSY